MSVVVYGFFKAIYLSILNGLYVRIWSFSEVYLFGPSPPPLY